MELLFIFILVGALIGYITNYIAIKLLFRPYKPIKMGDFTIFPQGVILREKTTLAKKVSSIVKEYLLSEDEVRKVLNNENVKNEISLFLENKIEDITNKSINEFVSKEELASNLAKVIDKVIKEKFSMFSAFVNEDMLKKLILEIDLDLKINELIDKNRILEIIKEEVFVFLDKELPILFLKADIDKVVEEKILTFDEKKIEEMLFTLMKKHFGFINFAGAFLGGLIGGVQYLIVYFY